MIKKSVNLLIVIIIFINYSLCGMANTEKELEKSQATQVLSLLNIVRGYEDNTLKLDKYITRAEMVTIIIRIMGLNRVIEYLDSVGEKEKNRVFKDLSSEHWAYNYIIIANNLWIVKGIEDYRFNPDDNITYQDAVTMIIRALGYEFNLKQIGDHPEAYLSMAKDLGVLEKINLESGDFVKRRDAIQMIFNSLTINLMHKVSEIEPKWVVTDCNFLNERLDIYKNYGRVDSIKGDYVYINDMKYKIGPTDAEKYIGLEVYFYYIKNEKEGKILIILEKG